MCYWLVLGGTGSQHGVVVVGAWWYWVSTGQCRLVLDGIGSVWSGIVGYSGYSLVLGPYAFIKYRAFVPLYDSSASGDLVGCH